MTAIKVAGGVQAADATPPEKTRHLNQERLARRWNVSPRTLEKWRSLKIGPSYLRLGGRIAYRLEDIETYEASQLRVLNSSRGPQSGREP